MSRELELDGKDEDILESLFSDDNVAALLEEFEEHHVRTLMEKMGLEFPEALEEEDEENEGVEEGVFSSED